MPLGQCAGKRILVDIGNRQNHMEDFATYRQVELVN